MKLITALFIILASIACSRSTPTEPVAGPGPVGPIGPGGSGIIGSGVYVEEDRPVSGFTDIHLAAVGTVFVEQAGSESLTVRAEDNVLSHLVTEVMGGVLEITVQSGITFEDVGPIEFFVTVRDLADVEISGAGRIEAHSRIVGSLNLVVAGAGDMIFTDLQGDRLNVTNNGAGKIKVAGRVYEQIVSLSGAGNYRAERLESVLATVAVHGAGSATVRVSECLDATVSGAGSIYYYGNPTVESSVSGTGGVERRGD